MRAAHVLLPQLVASLARTSAESEALATASEPLTALLDAHAERWSLGGEYDEDELALAAAAAAALRGDEGGALRRAAAPVEAEEFYYDDQGRRRRKNESVVEGGRRAPGM